MKLIYILLIILSFGFCLAQDYESYSLVPPYDIADWASHLEPEQRDRLEVTIKNGLLYREGKLYSTTTKDTKSGIFVISEDKKLYVSHQHDIYKFRHSSFLSGDKILAAGEIIIHEGKIIVMNNNSGHYLPASDSVYTFDEILMLKGYEGFYGKHPYKGITYSLEQRYNSYTLEQLLKINSCDFLLM